MPGINPNINLPDGRSFIPDPAKVTAMKEDLRATPYHLGRPSSDRRAWDPWKRHPVGEFWIADAHRRLGETPAHLTNALYARSYENDSRAVFTAVNKEVNDRLRAFLFAECVNPAGDYLALITDEITAFADLVTWVHPAHDQERENFDGKTNDIDLSSIHWALFFASVDFLLGDRLSAATRALIRSEVNARVFVPFCQRIRSGRDIDWWVTCDHNWNTVCVAGILGCALWLKPDIAERAWHLALADDLIKYSVGGFSRSGFYTEGVAYWNYGFGSYVTIAELVRGATDGRIDWLRQPLQRRMALFGTRIEIQDGVCPTYADSPRVSKPASWLANWLNNRTDPEPGRTRTTGTVIDPFETLDVQSLSIVLLNMFHTADDGRKAFRLESETAPREWFDDAQFLICRPRPGSSCELGATFMGGHNGVNHNHNDLGTFTVVSGGHALICDPGQEIYTDRTFSRDRYQGDLLNSRGHPVPVVAGRLQLPGVGEHRADYGAEFFTTVLETVFSEEVDRVVLDLTKAYGVGTLVKLERTFLFDCSGRGRIEVVDHFVFDRPESFESAVITFGEWEISTCGVLTIRNEGRSADVSATSDDGVLVFKHEVIRESSAPTRLAWRFSAPVRKGRIRIVVTPEPA